MNIHSIVIISSLLAFALIIVIPLVVIAKSDEMKSFTDSLGSFRDPNGEYWRQRFAASITEKVMRIRSDQKIKCVVGGSVVLKPYGETTLQEKALYCESVNASTTEHDEIFKPR